jgi:hypothetical protein
MRYISSVRLAPRPRRRAARTAARGASPRQGISYRILLRRFGARLGGGITRDASKSGSGAERVSPLKA